MLKVGASPFGTKSPSLYSGMGEGPGTYIQSRRTLKNFEAGKNVLIINIKKWVIK